MIISNVSGGAMVMPVICVRCQICIKISTRWLSKRLYWWVYNHGHTWRLC